MLPWRAAPKIAPAAGPSGKPPQWRTAPKQRTTRKQLSSRPDHAVKLCCAQGQVLLFHHDASEAPSDGEERVIIGVADEAGDGMRRVTSRPEEPQDLIRIRFDKVVHTVFPWPLREKHGVALTTAKLAAYDARALARIGSHLQHVEGSPLDEQTLVRLELKSAEADSASAHARTLQGAIMISNQDGEPTTEEADELAAAQRAKSSADSQVAAAEEACEDAVKASLSLSKAILLDVGQVQSSWLKAVATGLREYEQLQVVSNAIASKPHRSIADVRSLLAACAQLRDAVLAIDLDSLVAAGLRSKSSVGCRRYATGQPLVVWQRFAGKGGMWMDADVAHAQPTGGHDLVLKADEDKKVTLRLTPWNHGLRILTRGTFESVRLEYLSELQARHGRMADVLSGSSAKAVDLLSACMAIELKVTKAKAFDYSAKESLGGISSIDELSDWLHARHLAWCSDSKLPLVAEEAILITGGTASGKSVLMRAIAMHAVQQTMQDGGANLVPILVSGVQLAAWLQQDGEAFGTTWNIVDACGAHGEANPPPHYCPLRFILTDGFTMLWCHVWWRRLREGVRGSVRHLLHVATSDDMPPRAAPPRWRRSGWPSR